MMYKATEKGQALVIIALAAVGLFAFAALAIDGSRVYSERRHAQNAADASAYAAALAKIRDPNLSTQDASAIAAGLARAASNGYENDSNSTVEVHFCDEAGLNPPCEGLPSGAEPSEYIQVKIITTIDTTFARVIGRPTLTNMVTAITHAQLGVDAPPFDGAALVALAPTGSATVSGQGNVNLDINNSGVYDNSSSNCAMSVGGNGTYEVDTAYSVAGTYCESGNINLNGPVELASQVPYPPTIDIPTPSITCSGNGSLSGSTYNPGIYNGLTISGGNITFAPGNYCFNGNVTINGNTNIIANDVNFWISGGDFEINGNSTFTCNNMLAYMSGGSGGMHFNGNGSNHCTNVTFFAETGSVSWNGNVGNTFTAPTSGPYAHVLIYMPYGNNSPLTINGNSGNQLTGSIIAVSSNVTINGNSGTTGLHSAIISYTVTLSGNSNTTINYEPDEQYSQVDPTFIQLTK